MRNLRYPDELNQGPSIAGLNESEMSEGLKWHVQTNTPLCETVYRIGSDAHLALAREMRALLEREQIELCWIDERILKETDLGHTAEFEGVTVNLDCPMHSDDAELMEAEYKGKKVELNKPRRNSGSGKKYVVYTKNGKGNVVKVSFGDMKGGLTSKINDPEARSNFAKRHNCEAKNDKTTPGYWSCRLPRYAKLLGLKAVGAKWW
jgi:hypothetical protein